MKICSIIDCENPLLSRGYCNKHYIKWKRYGDATKVRPIRLCSNSNCNEKHQALGYCRKHYMEFRSQNGLTPRRIYHFRTNNHEICAKLGKRGTSQHYDEYPFKCSYCDVSYNKKSEQFFLKNNRCPCCNRRLRMTQVNSRYKRDMVRI